MTEKETVHVCEMTELEKAAFLLAIGEVRGPINEMLPEGMVLVKEERLEELKEHLPDEVVA